MHLITSTPTTPENNTATHAPLKIAIVGAGCTGLRIATLFKKLAKDKNQQIELIVFEAKDHLGGFLQSTRNTNNLIVESAAQGVLSSRKSFLRTLEDIGLQPSDVITPPREKSRQRRYIVSPQGQITPLTPNLFKLWRSGLLTPFQLLRILVEFFFIRKAQPQNFNETLYDFFKRHFGKACAENFILPFATGIWGGGSEKLLLRHAFPRLAEMEIHSASLLRKMVFSFLFKRNNNEEEKKNLTHKWPKGLISFPKGMHVLIEKMLSYLNSNSIGKIEFKLKTPIHSISKQPSGKFILNQNIICDCVFWTTGPWNSPNLVLENTLAQSDWEHLQNTPTHHLIVCNISGPRNARISEGFGVLANRNSDGLLGVLFTHSIYPAHVPPNHFSYRVLLAGDRNPEMIQWNDQKIQDYCLQKLKSLQLLPAEYFPYSIEIIRWPRAISLTDIDHDQRLSALWRIEACLPELYFAGIYKKGIGVADALASAEEAFERWLSVPRPIH